LPTEKTLVKPGTYSSYWPEQMCPNQLVREVLGRAERGPKSGGVCVFQAALALSKSASPNRIPSLRGDSLISFSA